MKVRKYFILLCFVFILIYGSPYPSSKQVESEWKTGSLKWRAKIYEDRQEAIREMYEFIEKTDGFATVYDTESDEAYTPIWFY